MDCSLRKQLWVSYKHKEFTRRNANMEDKKAETRYFPVQNCLCQLIFKLSSGHLICKQFPSSSTFVSARTLVNGIHMGNSHHREQGHICGTASLWQNSYCSLPPPPSLFFVHYTLPQPSIRAQTRTNNSYMTSSISLGFFALNLVHL